MKTIKLTALAVAAMLLLSACGLVNNFIPDQSAENVFGLDGQAVTLNAVSSAGLSTQAVMYQGSVSGEFGEVDTSDVPSGVRPSSVEETIALSGTIDVTFTDVATAPATVTIEAAALSITLDDGSSLPSVTVDEEASGLALTFTKGTCSGATCAYTADAATVAVLTAVISGQQFDAAWDLMTNGTSPNTVSGTFSVTLAQDLSATAITVTIQTSDGTIKFG